jgi:hypothetical protein
VTYEIEFENVGRNKRSWSVPCPCSPDNEDMVEFVATKSVKSKGALMSRDIETLYIAEERAGRVIVGGFRVVGAFKVVERAA